MPPSQTHLSMTKELNYFSPTGNTYTSDPRSKEGAGDDDDHRKIVCGRDVGIDAVGISSTTNDPAEPNAGQADAPMNAPTRTVQTIARALNVTAVKTVAADCRQPK
jgi:hypothetical protein